MKLRQRLYDSNNSVDNFDKINCDSLLSNNLDKIKNRKPIYSNRSQLMIRKKSNVNLEDYYRNKENLIYNQILGKIKSKEVKRVFNTGQNEIINNNIN